MNAPGYIPLVIEHFERPRHCGRFEPADDVIETSAGDFTLGTRFTLSARVSGGRIVDLRFEVYGCPHCVAAGSWLSDRLIGATADQLRTWGWQEVAEALQVPPEKRGRLLILEDAVHALADALDRSALTAAPNPSGR